VRLLDADPDLGRLLSPDEFAAAGRLTVPVLTMDDDHDGDLAPYLERGAAFGLLVLEGIVFRQLVVGEQLGMRLLGPGDLLLSSGDPLPMLVGESRWRAVPGTRLVVLGRDFLLAARRWPELFTGLQLRWGQQLDRLMTQLVICQMPRVDQRVLALMWLLAESWGRVTPAGTTLPLGLTHDALGALVGARRPTVTLALRELTERGAILHQEEGWLLLEGPPQPAAEVDVIRPPAVIETGPSMWANSADEQPRRRSEGEFAIFYASLQETVSQLREQHEASEVRYRECLARMVRTRRLCRESRELLARDRLTR
jgi:hypothetical protein